MANWYIYNSIGDPFVPASYVRMLAKPTCLVGCKVCSIYLDSNTVIPTIPFDNNTITYIATGLGSFTPQPATGKIFVYMRDCC